MSCNFRVTAVEIVTFNSPELTTIQNINVAQSNRLDLAGKMVGSWACVSGAKQEDI